MRKTKAKSPALTENDFLRLASACSRPPDRRPQLSKPYSDGKHIVAIDGRRMHIATFAAEKGWVVYGPERKRGGKQDAPLSALGVDPNFSSEKFPAWTKVVPEKFDFEVTVDPRDWKTIRAARGLIPMPSLVVRLSREGAALIPHKNSTNDTGHTHLQPVFFLEAIRFVSAPEVRVQWRHEQAVLFDAADTHRRAVVMPVRPETHGL